MTAAARPRYRLRVDDFDALIATGRLADAPVELIEDRDKAAVYARGGVPEYWLVDPDGRQIEVFRTPRPDGSYASKQTYAPGDRIPWPERDDAVDADTLLP